jgi:hypothetical protein
MCAKKVTFEEILSCEMRFVTIVMMIEMEKVSMYR